MKLLVELDSEADGGNKETKGTVPTVKIYHKFGQSDAEQCTTEVCLLNNAVTATFHDCWNCEMDTLILQESEHSNSDLEDDLLFSDQLSYSADKECHSNEVAQQLDLVYEPIKYLLLIVKKQLVPVQYHCKTMKPLLLNSKILAML